MAAGATIHPGGSVAGTVAAHRSDAQAAFGHEELVAWRQSARLAASLGRACARHPDERVADAVRRSALSISNHIVACLESEATQGRLSSVQDAIHACDALLARLGRVEAEGGIGRAADVRLLRTRLVRLRRRLGRDVRFG